MSCLKNNFTPRLNDTLRLKDREREKMKCSFDEINRAIQPHVHADVLDALLHGPITGNVEVTHSFHRWHSTFLTLLHVHCLTYSILRLTLIVFNVHHRSNFEGHVNVSSFGIIYIYIYVCIK